MTSYDDDLGNKEVLIIGGNNVTQEYWFLGTSTDSESEEKIKSDAGKDPETHRQKLWLSWWMFCAFVSLGLCTAQIGPSFLDLLSLTNSTLSEGSVVITFGSVGVLFGALSTGLFLQPFSDKFLTFISLLGIAICNVMMTWCPNLIILTVVNFGRSTFAAILVTVVPALCVDTWRKDSGTYMQAIHLGYAIGAFGSPLIVKPFLSPTQTTSIHSTATVNQTTKSRDITVSTISAINSTLFQTTEFMPNISISTSNLSKPPIIPETQIHYAYLILSIITIFTAFPFGFYSFKSGAFRGAEKIEEGQEMSLKWKDTVIPLFIIFLFFMTYCAWENTISIYLTTFTVKYVDWTKQDGSTVTFVFWLCYAFGGFIGIFIQKFLNANQMLLIDLSLLNICCFVLLWSKSLPILVWIFFGLLGLAAVGIYPTSFVWIETYLFKVTTPICSVISVFAAVGITLNPIFLGFMMEKYSPVWFLYIISGESLICLSVFLALICFSKSQYWQNKINHYCALKSI